MADKKTEAKHPRMQSLAELMEYVEKEAEKRAKEISKKYRLLSETKTYDRVILRLLKKANRPLSADLISFLTGVSKSHCHNVLRELEKGKLIKKTTICKTAYYEPTS